MMMMGDQELTPPFDSSDLFNHLSRGAAYQGDLLICGVCKLPFPLSDILRFIRHKVKSCGKVHSNLIVEPNSKSSPSSRRGLMDIEDNDEDDRSLNDEDERAEEKMRQMIDNSDDDESASLISDLRTTTVKNENSKSLKNHDVSIRSKNNNNNNNVTSNSLNNNDHNETSLNLSLNNNNNIAGRMTPGRNNNNNNNSMFTSASPSSGSTKRSSANADIDRNQQQQMMMIENPFEQLIKSQVATSLNKSSHPLISNPSLNSLSPVRGGLTEHQINLARSFENAASFETAFGHLSNAALMDLVKKSGGSPGLNPTGLSNHSINLSLSPGRSSLKGNGQRGGSSNPTLDLMNRMGLDAHSMRALESRTLEENLESALGHHLDPMSLNSLHSSILDSVKKSSPSITGGRNKLKIRSNHHSSHNNNNNHSSNNSGTNRSMNQSPYERSSPINLNNSNNNCRDSMTTLFNDRDGPLRDSNPFLNNTNCGSNSFNPGKNFNFRFFTLSHVCLSTIIYVP